MDLCRRSCWGPTACCVPKPPALYARKAPLGVVCHGSTRRGMGGPSRRRVGHRVPFTPACGCAAQSRGCAKVVIVMVSRLNRVGAFPGRERDTPAGVRRPVMRLGKPRGRANHDEHHHFLSCRSHLSGAPAKAVAGPQRRIQDRVPPGAMSQAGAPGAEPCSPVMTGQCCAALLLNKTQLIAYQSSRLLLCFLLLSCAARRPGLLLLLVFAAAVAACDGCGCC
jgi:hypothetical protein